MTAQDLAQLSAQVSQLEAIVKQQQAELEAMTRARSVPAAPAAPAAPTRRLLLGGAVASVVGSLMIRPARAQTATWSSAGTFSSGTAGAILSGYTGIGNTALGEGAGELLDPNDTSGGGARWNTAVGVEALLQAVPQSIGQGFGAQRNSAFGRGALRDLLDGYYNDAYGADAGRHCNRANRNTFLGNNAGKWVGALDPVADGHPWWTGGGVSDVPNHGSRNVLIGRNAGHEGVLAQSCVAVGYNAGANWGSNDSATAVGRNCLLNSRFASRTVGVGTFAMANSSTGGDDSVAVGFEALLNAAGNNNVAVGAWAGKTNTGGQNVFIGEQSGLNNAGSDNVMIGRHAGLNNSGDRNVFIGRMAGLNHVGRSNTLIVHNTSSSAPFIEGSMGESSAWWMKVRGDVLPHADGVWSLGSSSLRWKEVWAQDGTINTSDARLKEDVADEDLGLKFVESLRPVVWKWKGRGDGQDHRGLLAQEVQQAAEASGSSRKFSAVVDRGDELGLREREFLGPLIKAVQELSARVKELESGARERQPAPAM